MGATKMTEEINNSVDSELCRDDNFPYWHTPEEHSVFASIDRKKENNQVVHFQNTGDSKIFEEIFTTRVPTLQIWARRYSYLMDCRDKIVAKEDMFGELSKYFTKAVYTYKKQKGSFNTCLFTYLLNCVRNLQISKRAKKRLPKGMDANAMTNFILSLDHSYNDKDGDNKNTLGDIVSGQMKQNDNVVDQINFNETLDVISNGDSNIKGFLRKLGDGNTLSSLLKECKMVKGSIKIGKKQFNYLKDTVKYKRIVSDLIKKATNNEDAFSIVEYHVGGACRLYYTMEMHKTDDSNYILKIIRKLRRDKRTILSRLQ